MIETVNNTEWKTVTGCPAPLGVTKEETLINFAVSFPGVQECSLRLYCCGEKEPVYEEKMSKSIHYGSVFCVAVKGIELDSFEYTYVVCGVEQVDKYAPCITGREQFGKLDTVSLRGKIVQSEFDWSKDRHLKTDFSDLILYKLHVRGFTKHESSKVKYKGTYLGIIEKLDYLKELGVNALLLMPCVDFQELIKDGHASSAYSADLRNPAFPGQYAKVLNSVSEEATNGKTELEPLQKLNYWGYGAESFYFAPKSSYAYEPHNVCLEFKEMVCRLHENGIEVFMEMNFTSSISQSMRVDCLRYWVQEYHIDGFRLIASDGYISYFATDPYLAETKILSNSWNADEIFQGKSTPEYRNLAECNDNFSTNIRSFIKGDEGQVYTAGKHFIRNTERIARVNYITDNNGFTLADLYSYDIKRNEANGERNRDGTDFNFSWNCGLEGKSRKKKILQLRLKMIKNALMMLFFSQGTPLLLAGDEFGNSQDGNNNAYCQDNRIGWLEWNNRKFEMEIYSYIKRLIQLRREHSIFHNKLELKGLDYASCGIPDVSYHGTKAWYPDYSNYSRTLGILLCGKYAMKNRRTEDANIYFIMNMHWEPHQFDLPSLKGGSKWSLLEATDNVKFFQLQDKSCIVPMRTMALFIETAIPLKPKGG